VLRALEESSPVHTPVSGSRIPLPAFHTYYPDDHLRNVDPIQFGPLPACSISGAYISHNVSDYTLWTASFATPVTVQNGDYLTIPADTFLLVLNSTI